MTSTNRRTDWRASLQLFTSTYESIPSFTDIFDEASFYIFATVFIATTIAVVFLLSRRITIKEVDW